MKAYPVAELFHAPQGEGMHAGAQMTFVRLVGCSVGKRTCTFCDTDFDAVYKDLGGGLYRPEEILALVGDDRHVCLTGGEPLDRDLRPLLMALITDGHKEVHVETSGTVWPDWLDRQPGPFGRKRDGRRVMHALAIETGGSRGRYDMPLWVTISPKPGYIPEMVERVADEVKVILGGLGDGPGWPRSEDAIRWADAGKLVYVQPRNELHQVDRERLEEALGVVAHWPQLRLSPQIHKFLRTR